MNLKFLIIVAVNLVLILFVYQSIFKLQLEGDSWFYGWSYQDYYGSVFSQLSLRAIRTSLGGASLTYGLIQNNFGLSAIAFYSISVILKLISVVAFYFLVKKLTKSFIISLISSMLLAVTFVGVEATHWVFNMYAYIGLTFIIVALLTGYDLPTRFTFKKWLLSFLLACAGVWYATMRTNGIIPLIIFWALYKFITLRTKSSKRNLIFWIVGFSVFILIDKFLLGQMESDYSQKYIIGEGIRAISLELENHKYDFLASPAYNLGATILPDMTWYSMNFPKLFSGFGPTMLKSIILPSFLLFSLAAGLITSAIRGGKKMSFWKDRRFLIICFLGGIWSGFLYIVSSLGPLNFNPWVILVMALFGGYMMIMCISLMFLREVPDSLRDLFFISFLWSFLFLLLPLFQNGGSFLGTYHRYMATTAPAVPLFFAGLLVFGMRYKNTTLRVFLLLLIGFIFFANATSTKAFFDRKALVHSREVSDRIWSQLESIVPNKPQYQKNPPAIFFAAADNPIDQETLFESLQFGFDFRSDIKFKWPHNKMNHLYNNGNYKDLVSDVKKDPMLLDDFYALMVENQNLYDITKQVKEKIASDIRP